MLRSRRQPPPHAQPLCPVLPDLQLHLSLSLAGAGHDTLRIFTAGVGGFSRRHGRFLRVLPSRAGRAPVGADGGLQSPPAARSEEHTSELQSLMRISYAVFCLKNKKNTMYIQSRTESFHH